MIKKISIMLFALFLTIIMTNDNVNALSFSETISGNSCKYIDVDFINTSSPFKYSKVVINSASKKYTISFFGRMTATNYSVIGTSKTLSLTGNIYILPRSGMACPPDRQYCFGVGQSLTYTRIANNTDCTSAGVSSFCNIYGIRICNKENTSLNISGTVDLYIS